MDFVNKLVGGESKNEDRTSQTQEQQGQQEEKSGGFMDKLNSMAGGGQQSEKNEDAIDKGPSSPPLPTHPNAACGASPRPADQHGPIA